MKCFFNLVFPENRGIVGLWWGYRLTTTPLFLLIEYLNSMMQLLCFKTRKDKNLKNLLHFLLSFLSVQTYDWAGLRWNQSIYEFVD